MEVAPLLLDSLRYLEKKLGANACVGRVVAPKVVTVENLLNPGVRGYITLKAENLMIVRIETVKESGSEPLASFECEKPEDVEWVIRDFLSFE